LKFRKITRASAEISRKLTNLTQKIQSTVSEGDLGQISALALDCGAVEYNIHG
jgi:hypothetical protein